MSRLISVIFILGVVSLFTYCSQTNSEKGKNKLPILGRKHIENIKVGAQTKADTVYHTISDYKFVDQDSNFISPSTFKDKVYVADFFFTTCPTICPKMKTQMLRLYEEFENNDQVALLSHTIDPEYDTVELLHDYAQKLGVESDKWHFVTGDKSEIYSLAKNSYMATAEEEKNAPGGFIHSGAFILVDKSRRIRGIYDGTVPADVDELMNDIYVLLEEYK